MKSDDRGRFSLPRYAEHAGFLVIAAIGLLIARAGLEALPDRSEPVTAPVAAGASALQLPDYTLASDPTLRRLADVHTLIPTRDRLTILKYVVQQGDSLFGISNRFGLEPETVLWGNFDVLEGQSA